MKNAHRLPLEIHQLHHVIAPPYVQSKLSDGSFGYSVLHPYPAKTLQRFRAAWWVLTGRAQAIKWPTADELNKVLKFLEEAE